MEANTNPGGKTVSNTTQFTKHIQGSASSNQILGVKKYYKAYDLHGTLMRVSWDTILLKYHGEYS